MENEKQEIKYITHHTKEEYCKEWGNSVLCSCCKKNLFKDKCIKNITVVWLQDYTSIVLCENCLKKKLSKVIWGMDGAIKK